MDFNFFVFLWVALFVRLFFLIQESVIVIEKMEKRERMKRSSKYVHIFAFENENIFVAASLMLLKKIVFQGK